MKRRILLVDDEVAVLLTLKAVLEISGFDVDTATSAREGKARIRHREYEMVITDMRMEGEHAGREVIAEARKAAYKPAVALLTAFPIGDSAWQDMGADKMLVKPMHTRALLQQLEQLFDTRAAEMAGKSPAPSATAGSAVKKSAAKRSATRKIAAPAKKVATPAVKKAVATKLVNKTAAAKKAATKKLTPLKKAAARFSGR